MAEFLVVRLTPDRDSAAHWVAVDEMGGPLGPVSSGPLDGVASEATGRRVIALVPSVHVLRTSVDVPIRGGAKLAQALPFALEEQLAEDLDRLHCAAGKRLADGRVAVAAVRHEHMQEWQTLFAAADLEPHVMYADGDALGDIPSTAVLLVDGTSATLRDVDGSLAVSDLEDVEAFVDLWLAGKKSHDEDGSVEPVNLLVYGSLEREAVLTALADGWRDRVETLDLKLLADGVLPKLAAQAVSGIGVNLLQGIYARHSDLMRYWPAWRVAAMLLLGLSALVLGVKAAEIYQMKRQERTLDRAIDAAFRYTFPDVGEIVDPRGQLESKLRALGRPGSNSGAGRFLETLQVVASAVASVSSAELEALNYRDGVMELRLKAPNVDTLDQIQKHVRDTSGLTAEIQSANADGDQVLGRLQVKVPGA